METKTLEQWKNELEVKPCENCPTNPETGKRMFCQACAERYIKNVCKGFQIAFGYDAEEEEN